MLSDDAEQVGEADDVVEVGVGEEDVECGGFARNLGARNMAVPASNMAPALRKEHARGVALFVGVISGGAQKH